MDLLAPADISFSSDTSIVGFSSRPLNRHLSPVVQWSLHFRTQEGWAAAADRRLAQEEEQGK